MVHHRFLTEVTEFSHDWIRFSQVLVSQVLVPTLLFFAFSHCHHSCSFLKAHIDTERKSFESKAGPVRLQGMKCLSCMQTSLVGSQTSCKSWGFLVSTLSKKSSSRPQSTVWWYPSPRSPNLTQNDIRKGGGKEGQDYKIKKK